MGNNLFQIPLNPPMQFTQKPLKQSSLKNNKPELKQKSPKKDVQNISNINSEIKNMFTSSKVYPSRKTSMDLPMTSALLSSEFFSKKSISQSEEIIGPSIKTMTYNDYELHFFRNEQEIRNTYFAKLIYKNVLCSQVRPKTFNSLIILDWDDTLLCNSFLAARNGLDFTTEIKLNRRDKEKISTLEDSVLKLLTLCVEKGDTYIITNAEHGWVEYSAEKYYPKIMEVLKKINVISAREKYSKFYPNDTKIWKIQTFLDITKVMNSELVTNVICMGDSFIEIEAGNKMREKFVRNQAFVKTIKFRESPKPEELNKQLRLIIEQFHDIYASIKNLTINVERRKKMSC